MNDQEQKRQADALVRVPALVAHFGGAIKYLPMLLDHPDWTDEDCVVFARTLHAQAIAQLRERGASMDGGLGGGRQKWNASIAYCRNAPTATMLKEAGL